MNDTHSHAITSCIFDGPLKTLYVDARFRDHECAASLQWREQGALWVVTDVAFTEGFEARSDDFEAWIIEEVSKRYPEGKV